MNSIEIQRILLSFLLSFLSSRAFNMTLFKQLQFHENFQKLSIPFSEFELWLVSVSFTVIDIILSFLDAHTHTQTVTYSEAELKTGLEYSQYIPPKSRNSHPNKMPFNFTTSINFHLGTCIFLLSLSLLTFGIQFFKFLNKFFFLTLRYH